MREGRRAEPERAERGRMMLKLDMSAVVKSAEGKTLIELGDELAALQVAVYVMCGGGLLGRFAAEQPADFYIDDRCGKLPYPKRAIYQTVCVLEALAKAAGKDPRNLGPRPHFHCCGVF